MYHLYVYISLVYMYHLYVYACISFMYHLYVPPVCTSCMYGAQHGVRYLLSPYR